MNSLAALCETTKNRYVYFYLDCVFLSRSIKTVTQNQCIDQLQERIEEAIGASTDAGYTAALELLRKDTASQKAPVSVADFIGSSAGGYGYRYGYVY